MPLRSAGIVPVRRTKSGWRLLILRAYRNWDFPKGSIEPGESPLEAALRETKEEAALADLSFPFGEGFCETAPYGHGKVARYYLGTTETAHVTLLPSPELGRPEHHEARWVSFDEAAELLPPRLAPVLEWARRTLAADEPSARRGMMSDE
jgi:8-oxo-dGTP pyrophosphatase MutT (NUDIX family)